MKHGLKIKHCLKKRLLVFENQTFAKGSATLSKWTNFTVLAQFTLPKIIGRVTGTFYKLGSNETFIFLGFHSESRHAENMKRSEKTRINLPHCMLNTDTALNLHQLKIIYTKRNDVQAA